MEEPKVLTSELIIDDDTIRQHSLSLVNATTTIEKSVVRPGWWYVGVLGKGVLTQMRGPVFACGLFPTYEEAFNVAATLRDMCEMRLGADHTWEAE